MRNSVILFSMLSLTACGDPLANFERIEDVELAADQPIAQALPDAQKVAPTDGLLARILKPVVEQESPDIEALAIAQAVANQTDISSDVVALDDTVPSVDVVAAPVTEVKKPVGLRGWLQRAAAFGAVADEQVGVVDDLAVSGTVEADVEALIEPEKRDGVLGGVQPVEDAPETVRTASLEPELSDAPSVAEQVEPKKRAGLFGDDKRVEPRGGPDARDVPVGTILPFGTLARVCDLSNKKNQLGQLLDQTSARGYALYDSSPDSVDPRTFYVTGFADNCPRQFTAALALFGAPETHEQLRYGLPSDLYPYSTTDKAYEKVKSSVCRVGKKKPCGAKISQLERNTVFISTYEKFTDNARWADILLHDGVVLAAAVKTP